MLIEALIMSATTISSCEEERIAVDEIAEAIGERYVIESIAKTSAETLRRKNAKGEFDVHCNDNIAFSQFLTQQLRTITGDKHFYAEVADASDDPEEDGWVVAWRKEAASNAYGVRRVERFAGNIGYLALSSFYEYAPAKRALAGAFDLLSTSDAAILDLRGNGGGSPETAWPIEWTFKDAGSGVFREMETRVGTPTKLTEPDFIWQRYGSKRPLVILIDSRSFSASEAVAYGLQANGRAIVIGESSGGGAHMLGDGVAIAGGWKIGIPETRPINRTTGTNWEKIGVTPEFEVSPNTALTFALEYLREQLATVSEKP